jgi:hypothetical protein
MKPIVRVPRRFAPYQPLVIAMTPPETPSNPATPTPAADVIHETLRVWRGEEEQRAQPWWRRMWRWIFSP